MTDNNALATTLHTLDNDHDYDRTRFLAATDKDYSQTAANREAFIEKYHVTDVQADWRNSELAEYLSYNYKKDQQFNFLFQNDRRFAYATDGQTHEILLTSVSGPDAKKRAEDAAQQLAKRVQADLRRKMEFEVHETDDSVFDAGTTADLIVFSR